MTTRPLIRSCHNHRFLPLLVLLCLIVFRGHTILSFSFQTTTKTRHQYTIENRYHHQHHEVSCNDDDCREDEDKLQLHRNINQCQNYFSSRRLLVSSTIGFVTSGILTATLCTPLAPTTVANAAATDSEGSVIGTVDHPIVIIGGSGRTGMAVAEALTNPNFGNMHVVTLSRSGQDPFRSINLPSEMKQNLMHRSVPFDVRDSQESISQTIIDELSPSVIVYAASASKQGGTAYDVDDEGVEKVAKACSESNNKTPSASCLFVLISALAVDRPDSKSYQITNTLGGNYKGIMDAKFNGENKLKELFASSSNTKYVIIRPGVLLNGKTLTGPVGIELNQGDTIGGGISRDELAGVVVGAIKSQSVTKQSYTVEAYRRKTATKLQPEFSIPSGNELTIASSLSSSNDLYRELFAKVKVDDVVK